MECSNIGTGRGLFLQRDSTSEFDKMVLLIRLFHQTRLAYCITIIYFYAGIK